MTRADLPLNGNQDSGIRADQDHDDDQVRITRADQLVSDTPKQSVRADHEGDGSDANRAGQTRIAAQFHDARADDLLDRIRTLAELYEDLQRVRVGNGNRLSHSEWMPYLAVIQPDLVRLEHQVELQLQRLWRQHPLAPWAKEIRGVGELTMARLVACLGDPADRLNPSQLWRYCGLDPTQRRRKGMSEAEARLGGNPKVKMLLLAPDTGVAAQIVRQRPEPYRGVYDEAKARFVAERAEWPLIRCERAARRVAVKRLIRDLWVEAWRLRCEQTGEKRPRPRTGATSGRGRESQRRHQAARR